MAERAAQSGVLSNFTVDVPAVDIASLAANTAVDTAVLVPGVLIGDSIEATPLGVWPAGAVMGPHRCLVDGTVQMRVGNCTIGAVDPVAQTIRFNIRRPSF